VVQRTSQARLISDEAAAFTFWGWQAVIVLVAITLPLGYTTTKEYAEPEWPINILIAVVWLTYAYVFFGTIARRRRVKHIYVANWFYGAFIITIAILHVVNNLSIPVSMWKSYSIYPGTIDAMVQWWYGHNAVGFYLTAGFLGLMYYFVPKQANRPIYSYRLSIVHFWALIATYVWAGGHHLHYSPLPEWAQTTSMIMSLILLAPSWGHDQWHHDPVRRLVQTAYRPDTAFPDRGGVFLWYGHFRRAADVHPDRQCALHSTDWTVGHVHSGALGWVAMISFGALYHMFPRLYGLKDMFSIPAINLHFWLATLGVVLYTVSMWINGLLQGLMWRAVNDDGTLTYSFAESVDASYPGYVVRFIGGAFFLAGMLVMAWNVWRTTHQSETGALDNSTDAVQGANA